MNDNVSRIKNILKRIMTNDDYNNPLSFSEILERVNLDEEYLMESSLKLEILLQEKFAKCSGNKDDFQQNCLEEYAAYIISLIKDDYKDYLNIDAIKRLDDLVSKKKITISKKLNGGASHTNGNIEMEYVDINDENYFQKLKINLSVLIHEIFHQTHRFRVGIDLPYKIDDKSNFGFNCGGYLFEEGLTEKCTIDFAKKHNLFHSPAFKYLSYVELVQEIEAATSKTNGQLFNQDYRNIFQEIDKSSHLLSLYNFTELSRFTSDFRKKESTNVTFIFNGKTYKPPVKGTLSKEMKEAMNSRRKRISDKKTLLAMQSEIIKTLKEQGEFEDISSSIKK